MVDIHSHILPEVDDGAKSWEMAVHMCQMAASDGIDVMVATPHANDEFSYDRAWLTSILGELQQRVGPSPRLMLGCDFHFSFDNLEALAKDPHRFTIGPTSYLLIELSDYAIPPGIGERIQGLLDRGLHPVLTHPERNPLLQHAPQRVVRWAEMGCIVQVTASSLTGRWGERALKMSHALLERQAVHVIATDAHNVDGRPPILSAARRAVAKQCGEDVANALVDANPRAIINGQPLPYFPAPEM